jgi:chloramphenicol O-acetyltransferase type A
MKIITFTNPHRQKHFDFFRSMDQPHFNLVANVDITHFLAIVKIKNLPFTPAIVYLLARAANELTAFRWRIRGDEVVEHASVQPSFTVPTLASEVFSFCTVDYHPHAPTFVARALATMEKMKNDPDFEDEPGRDDYLYLSAIPWVSFTGLSHAMHYSPPDSVPRISWGKYFQQGEQTLMPLAVQAHHAVVDGRDMGQYFQNVQTLLAESAEKFQDF